MKHVYAALLIVILGVGSVARADAPLTVEASASEVYVGETFRVHVKIAGDMTAEAPDLSALTNCTVAFLTRNASSFTSVQIVNGRTQRSGFTGTTFIYDVTPLAEGSLTLGPVRATIGKRTVEATGPTVAVAGGDVAEILRLKTTPSTNRVIVGESFNVLTEIFIRELPGRFARRPPVFPNEPPQLSASYLNTELIDGMSSTTVRAQLQEYMIAENSVMFHRNVPGFAINSFSTGFWNQKAKFSLPHSLVTIDGRRYHRYAIEVEFTSMNEGSYSFGPARITGSIPEIDAHQRQRRLGVSVIAPAFVVQVLAPPMEGRPESYTGIIGRDLELRVASELDTQNCHVNDPLELTLRLTSQTPLGTHQAPNLATHAKLAESFAVYDAVPLVRNPTDVAYRYTIRPRKAGTYDLPAIEVGYYDVGTRSYATAASRPLPLKVRESHTVSVSEIFATEDDDPGRERTDAKRVTAPLRITPLRAQAGSLWGAPWRWMTAAIGPAAFFLVLGVQVGRRHVGRGGGRRRAQARAAALIRAARRAASHDPPAATSALCEAAQTFLGSHFGVPAAGLTPADAERLLADVEDDLARPLVALFERHANRGYGGDDDALDVPADCDELERRLEALGRHARGARKEVTHAGR